MKAKQAHGCSLLVWHGCYDGNWKGLITGDSFAHPAKYSKNLIERIFDHLLATGRLHAGDTVGDTFGGIATGGIVAAYRGLAWRGVELEPHFVAMANANIELHRQRLEQLGKPVPVIVQGDSRNFDTVIAAHAVVTSPPYAAISAGAGGLNTKPTTKPGQQGGRSAKSASQTADQRYGHSKGQISQLKDGSIEHTVDRATDHAETRSKSETYWDAMLRVYSAAFRAIVPGGCIAVVVKDYVRNKQRVRLCDDTLQLLTHVGFVAHERIRAMLVSETREQGLDGQTLVHTRQRKSFFKRLHESRLPVGSDCRIDWEEVLILDRP